MMGTLLDAYESVQKRNIDVCLPKMSSGHVSLRKKAFDTSEEALAYLESCLPVCGWLQYQSHQSCFIKKLPKAENNYGSLLACEVVLGETAHSTLKIEYDGLSAWRCVTATHAGGANAGNDDDGIYDCVRHLVHKLNYADFNSNDVDYELCYRRYWILDKELGYRQDSAWLVGIEPVAHSKKDC